MRLNTDKRGWIYTAVLAILSIPAYLPERTAEARLTFGGIKEAGTTDPRLASPAPITLVSLSRRVVHHPLGTARDRHKRQVKRLHLMEGQ